MVSVIIPTYNEEKLISDCLRSIEEQSFNDLEVFVIDDGSTDNTLKIIQDIQKDYKFPLQILTQKHIGPGSARNLGAKKAKGDILVFIDSDMVFSKDFIKNLIKPILDGETMGTFSKDEFLLNKNNIWARFWNINLGRKSDRMHPDNYPDTQPVFRAIVKKKFDEAGGFDTRIGYTDDWSLSRKLNTLATVAQNAVFYHNNPGSLKEVWIQARWFGKNEFLTRNFVRKIYNLMRYSLVVSLIKGTYGSFRESSFKYLLFKIIYDYAVFLSVCLSFFREKKFK